MSIGAMMALTESRRRRDKRGRYMDGDDGPTMGDYTEGAEHGNQTMARYYPGGMPPISPSSMAADYPGRADPNAADRRPYRRMESVGENRMEYESPEMRRGRRRRSEGEEGPRMGGLGGFVWDSMNGDYPRGREDREEEDDSQRMQRPGYPWGMNEQGGNITSMHDYAKGKEHKAHDKPLIGFKQGEDPKEKDHLTKEEAEEWVDQMRTKDGRPGKRWTYDEIRQYAGNYGISGEQKIIDFFVVLNMMYSDYCQVAKKLGVDRMDFYAGMAKAFMDDPDAAEGKLVKYREYIAKEEE